MNPKRIPKQDRGIETKTRILEAGLRLFTEKGLHGTSSREIAGAAGVAIGSFYSYFKDKRELFIELLKTHRINMMEILDNSSSKMITNKNRSTLIKKLIETIWVSHEATHEFDRKAEILRGADPEIDAIINQQEEAGLNHFLPILKSIEPMLRRKDIDTAALVVSVTIREFMHSTVKATTKDKNRIIDELTDMISRYLFK
jgi:AcrR family transcriptional regulator